MAIVGHNFDKESELNAAIAAARRSGDVTSLTSGPGCYSVVLSHAGGLAAYSDPVGQFPLFWARAGKRVLVGPSASALAAEIGDSVDVLTLAAGIACPGVPDLFPDRTTYHTVRRIPEGTVFQVDKHGVRQSAYGRIRAGSSTELADTADSLRDCLRAAVRIRLDVAEKLSADFSGGFDSTSLALLAASEAPVLAITSAGFSSSDSDDVCRARAYARTPAITHRIVPTSIDSLPFQILASAGEEPHATPMFLGPLRARLAVASVAGADLHLVGEGGDVLLDAPRAYLGDLARSGNFVTLWRHCVSLARVRTRSPVRLFRRAMVLGATSLRRALLALARVLERGGSDTPSSWEADWICRWRQPRTDLLTTRARLTLAAGIRELANHDTDPDSIGDMVTRSRLRGQTLTQRAVRGVGQEFGITVHAPFLDTDVVRACLSLQACRRVAPATYKPLLREAIADLIPKHVLSHSAKGDYTTEAFQGVRRAAPLLRRLFADSAAADYGLIEPRPVLAVLDGAVQGLRTPWDALNQVIAVELWLRDIQEGAVAA